MAEKYRSHRVAPDILVSRSGIGCPDRLATGPRDRRAPRLEPDRGREGIMGGAAHLRWNTGPGESDRMAAPPLAPIHLSAAIPPAAVPGPTAPASPSPATRGYTRSGD